MLPPPPYHAGRSYKPVLITITIIIIIDIIATDNIHGSLSYEYEIAYSTIVREAQSNKMFNRQLHVGVGLETETLWSFTRIIAANKLRLTMRHAGCCQARSSLKTQAYLFSTKHALNLSIH